MKKHIVLLVAGLLAASTASAISIDIDTVLVGDAGNANDSTGYGGVGYSYNIGTYEVTNSQYTTFLNSVASSSDTHGLYNSGMSITNTSGTYSTSEPNKPVKKVSFWDAARFSNWLTTGGTETGVYNLNGTTAPTNNTITRDETVWNNGGVAIASENEWYKAAYYDGNGGYYDYPTQSNTAPTAEDPPGGANSANYDNRVGTVTDVGAYTGSDSHYGTFDQGGNVREWSDTIVNTGFRALRGGSFFGNNFPLRSSDPGANGPEVESNSLGFRVSSLEPIPEPSAYAAILGCLGLTIAAVRRKGRLPISDCR